MATYNTLTKGSTGADVKKLQQSLIDKGYDLGPTGADGKYGAKTQAAVTQYQKDNKLTVDGMAGKQTQGSLYTVAKPTTTTTGTTATGTKQNTVLSAGDTVNKEKTVLGANEPITKEKLSDGAASGSASGSGNEQTHETDPLAPPTPTAYDPTTDAAYQSALATLLQVQQATPTYKDSYSSQLQDIYDKIVNREKFSYDVNSDAMYQQMKDQYIAQGKMAMQDTMGQAAALNGGYGSSYSQSVGQQAYQGYMQQLNDNIPELYDRALAQYNQEGQDMLTQYSMLGDMADDEYQKYLTEMDMYYKNLDMARQDAETAYNRGYGAYRDSVGDSQWQQQYAETVKQNEIANSQWQQSFDENVKQNEIGNQQWEESFGYQKEQDAISNNQWQQSFDHEVEQDKIANERYEDELLKEEERNTKSEYYNRVMSYIGTDYVPTDKELYVAGITREQYNAINRAATSEAPSNVLWTYTGARDAQDNLIYENNLGERKTFGDGVNPYTGTSHPDAQGEGNTFSNGYQPNNIGGTPLKNSGMSTNVTGVNQTIWEANGKYWLWRGDLNTYMEVDLGDVAPQKPITMPSTDATKEYSRIGAGGIATNGPYWTRFTK